MVTNQSIQFKNPKDSIIWLQAALSMEQKKYAQIPVLPDMMPGYETASAWGYVVAGYFLIEECFKVILYLRGTQVPTRHSLTMLFNLFEPADQDVLREYYSDYRATIGGYRANFPIATLDEFLQNLDGDPNKSGTDYMGSFDWRYFLIEEKKSQDMPFISIDYLHEVALGCINIAEGLHHGYNDPRRHTHTWRIRRQRQKKYNAWLMVRMNTEGWGSLSDRLEILWGPDYRGRHDLLLFEGNGHKAYFSELPENFTLPIIDKRAELEAYDVEEGYRSIGIEVISPPTLR